MESIDVGNKLCFSCLAVNRLFLSVNQVMNKESHRKKAGIIIFIVI